MPTFSKASITICSFTCLISEDDNLTDDSEAEQMEEDLLTTLNYYDDAINITDHPDSNLPTKKISNTKYVNMKHIYKNTKTIGKKGNKYV